MYKLQRNLWDFFKYIRCHTTLRSQIFFRIENHLIDFILYEFISANDRNPLQTGQFLTQWNDGQLLQIIFIKGVNG